MKKIISIVLVVMSCIVVLACRSDLDRKAENLTAYDIDCVLDTDNKTLQGKMSVDYFNDTQGEMNKLVFQLYGNGYRLNAKESALGSLTANDYDPSGKSYGYMEVSEVIVNGQSVNAVKCGPEDYCISVDIPTLYPDERVQISMSFQVYLASVRHRLGYYNDFYNLGNFYPVLCRYVDGNFNMHPYYAVGDPFDSQVANYNVKLDAPLGYTVATTGKSQTIESGDRQIVTASALCVRDFAMTVGKYIAATTTTNRVTVDYFASETRSDGLRTAVDALNTFSELFGAYPYDHLTIVETPFSAGGMEYPQLVMISDVLTGEARTEAIIHEIAHQWWYAVVGNDQINEAWLDEGLAEYSTTLFYEFNSSYGVSRNARIADALSAYTLYIDIFGAQGAMSRPLGEFGDSMEYVYSTYVKGSLMLEDVRNLVGDKVFFAALSSYYDKNKFAIATSDMLIGEFEKAYGNELNSFFRAWLDGKVQAYAK